MTLCKYKFKNGKTMRLELVSPAEAKKRKLNEVDNYVLTFEFPTKKTVIGLRADEVPQIITILSYGMWAGVKAYHLAPLGGYNGFQFHGVKGKRSKSKI